uniref:DUF4231 domain-containing protein n=1 Tax=Nocardia cyriacigeorgica TaxID=135487 RepID=UPI0024572C7C
TAVGSPVPDPAPHPPPAPAPAAAAFPGVVAEGAQQLFQWHTNWMLYRSTAEALKHEKFLYLASTGPYAGPDARAVLAARVESLVSDTNTTWAAEHERQAGSSGGPPVTIPESL